MQPRDQRRAYLALGASVAVHAAAGAVLIRLGSGLLHQPNPRPAPLELALVELPARRAPPSPAPLAPAHVAAPLPAAPKLPSAPRPGWRGERGRAGASVGGPGAAASSGGAMAPALPAGAPSEPVPGPPAATRSAPGSTAWLEAEGLSPGQAATAPILLAPVRGAGAAAAGLQDSPGLDPSHPEDRRVAAARAKDRIDGWFQELKATDRAENLPDVYWTGLRDRLEAGLQVAWGVLEQGPDEDGVVSGSRVGQALQAWQREAERWARGTDPGPPAGDPEVRALEAARSLLSAHGLGEPGKPARALFLTDLVTQVELEQGADGALSSYRLIHSSGNSAHDALVLARLRALAAEEAERLGPPPEQGRRTRWAVRTRFEMVPPVPIVGCGFDATFRITDCFYPLKRTVKSAARLERVYDTRRPEERERRQASTGGGMEGATPSGAYEP
jgi:hypothetical protein